MGRRHRHGDRDRDLGRRQRAVVPRSARDRAPLRADPAPAARRQRRRVARLGARAPGARRSALGEEHQAGRRRRPRPGDGRRGGGARRRRRALPRRRGLRARVRHHDGGAHGLRAVRAAAGLLRGRGRLRRRRGAAARRRVAARRAARAARLARHTAGTRVHASGATSSCTGSRATPRASSSAREHGGRDHGRRRLEDVPAAAPALLDAQGAGAAPVPLERDRRAARAPGRVGHGRARRVLRHRRPQRERQEHAAQVPRRDLRGRRREHAGRRQAVAVHRARRRLQSRPDGARQRADQRDPARPLAARGARAVRRHHRVRRARGVPRPQAQELLVGHARAARVRGRDAGRRRRAADRRGARGRRRRVPAEVLRPVPQAQGRPAARSCS